MFLRSTNMNLVDTLSKVLLKAKFELCVDLMAVLLNPN